MHIVLILERRYFQYYPPYLMGLYVRLVAGYEGLHAEMLYSLYDDRVVKIL